MKFAEKKVILKNGIECLLKSPGTEDAEAILYHLRKTSGETSFMARYEEEVTMTSEEERKFLGEQLANEKNFMIACEIDGKIVANAGITGVMIPLYKYQYRAEFGISIQKEFWGLGIGSAILPEIIATAKTVGFEQIELEVVADNERAISLYKKFGFEMYGTREHSFKYKDGSYGAEHLMLLML